MLKKTKGISINIVSVFVILTCLLLSCVGVTNAWFTSEHQNGVEIVVNIGDLKLSLYQKIGDNYVQVFNNTENKTSANPNYIVLDNKIVPDEDVNLNLKINNEDPGSTSMYLRFKFELFIRGVEEDTLLPCNIDGFDEPTETSYGFTYNNGYYYYTNVNGENVQFAKSSSAILMESFNVDYSNFIESDGDFALVDSDVIYIKLTIDASVLKTFA